MASEPSRWREVGKRTSCAATAVILRGMAPPPRCATCPARSTASTREGLRRFPSRPVLSARAKADATSDARPAGGLGAQITARGFGETGAGNMGPAPVVRMTDALQGRRGAPPQDPQGALQGLQLTA